MKKSLAAVRPRVGICDYGVGNLRSVERALAVSDAEVIVSDNAGVIAGCDGAVLPGVGAFAPAALRLRQRGLDAAITALAQARRPVLGVCLGFQLMFESSSEGGGGKGLGLFPGEVSRIKAPGLKIPHMGWNRLHIVRPAPLLEGIAEGTYVYFVHSYGATTARGEVIATTDHGAEIIAACQHGAVMGTQFHPEKSGEAGLRVYANFVTACAAVRARGDAPVGGGGDGTPVPA